MGPYKRNWFVGGTVLLGLVTLGVLIILFGGSLGSVFAGEKFAVTFKSERADGISDGSIIRYLGQQVGTIKSVRLVLDKTPNFVEMRAELDKDKRLPADARGMIRVLSPLGGSAVIELESPTAGASPEILKGGETIATEYVGSSVIPPEVATLSAELRAAVKEFREAGVIADIKVAVNNFNAQVAKAGKVMEDVDAVLGSEASQTDLKTAIANFREATTRANTVLANFEKISGDFKGLPTKVDGIADNVNGGVTEARAAIADAKQRIATVSDNLNRNLIKLAGVMDDAKQMTEKINKGQGTAGLLISDSKLYDKLVVATEAITETVKDVQRLARGFEQEGVPLKLGK